MIPAHLLTVPFGLDVRHPFGGFCLVILALQFFDGHVNLMRKANFVAVIVKADQPHRADAAKRMQVFDQQCLSALTSRRNQSWRACAASCFWI